MNLNLNIYGSYIQMNEKEPPDDNESYLTTKTSFLDILYTFSVEKV